MNADRRPFQHYAARHFHWQCSDDGRVATITLNRPEKKNPLTFDSYAELRDLFLGLQHASDVRVVVLTGAGGNFCSGGDVFEIIEPLTKMPAPELLRFTRMTGDLVKAMKRAPQPVVAAIDGICAGAGAMIALAADLRLGHAAGREAQPRQRVRRDDLDALGDLEARRAGLHQEGAQAVRAAARGGVAFAGAGEDAVEVGDAAVADPGLLAVEHIGIAVVTRRAGDGGDVGTRLGLRQREGADPITTRHPGQHLGLQRRAAGQRDRAAAQALHREGEVGQAVVARQRLAAHHERARIQRLAGATVGRRHAVAQEACVAQRTNQGTAGAVGIVMIDADEVLRRPVVEFVGQRAVAVVEEGQRQMIQPIQFNSPRTSAAASPRRRRRRA